MNKFNTRTLKITNELPILQPGNRTQGNAYFITTKTLLGRIFIVFFIIKDPRNMHAMKTVYDRLINTNEENYNTFQDSNVRFELQQNVLVHCAWLLSERR